MKSIKVFCALGILALLISCTSQEEAVTFFIDNELNENLIIQRVNEESGTLANINSRVSLDLRTSESYNKYIRRLRDLEINNFEFLFDNYQGQIQNGKVYLEDILLGDFDASMGLITIEDNQVIQRIENLFLERTEVDFIFVGESQSNHFLSVEINVEMKGTFVH